MLEVLLLAHWVQVDLHKKVKASLMDNCLKHNYTPPYRQAYFLPLKLEVGLLGHQRGQDLKLGVKHWAQEDL